MWLGQSSSQRQRETESPLLVSVTAADLHTHLSGSLLYAPAGRIEVFMRIG
jgi:hypothetical protein